MFKNLTNHLKELSQVTQLSVPVDKDADGYVDRECPDEKCFFQFKIHCEDWAEIVRDQEVFCPSCRHAAPALAWFTRHHIQEAHEHALSQIKAGLNSAMRADAAASKRRKTRNSFLSLTLDVKGFPHAALLPLKAADPMRLRTTCETCHCRYSYIGAAFFCPSCGNNSASHTFRQTLATVRTAATLGETLRATLGPDEANTMTHALLEKGVQDTVMCFQRLCEQFYGNARGPKARRNAFQNLEAGSELWMKAKGFEYANLVEPDQLHKLALYFQQRHLLAHQQGIVDADYIQRSGDETYAVGQRLVIKPDAVLEFAGLVEILGQSIISRLG